MQELNTIKYAKFDLIFPGDNSSDRNFMHEKIVVRKFHALMKYELFMHKNEIFMHAGK